MYMESQDYIIYGSYFILAIFIIYFIFSLINIQSNVVEGLTNNNHVNIMDKISKDELKNIQKHNKKLEDLLRVDKYRTNYEDYLIDLDEYMNNTILAELIMLNVDDDKELENKISKLNELYKFKENLNSTMEFVDGKKASKSGLF